MGLCGSEGAWFWRFESSWGGRWGSSHLFPRNRRVVEQQHHWKEYMKLTWNQDTLWRVPVSQTARNDIEPEVEGQWMAFFVYHSLAACCNWYLDRDYKSFWHWQGNWDLAKILNNFLALIECTPFVGARKFRTKDSAKLEGADDEYTQSLNVIHPNFHIQPNHHETNYLPAHM